MTSEWLKVMLDEIARKKAEAERDQLEAERRLQSERRVQSEGGSADQQPPHGKV